MDQYMVLKGDKPKGIMMSVAMARSPMLVTIDLNRFVSAKVHKSSGTPDVYVLYITIKGSGWYKYVFNEYHSVWYVSEENAIKDYQNLIESVNKWNKQKSAQ